MGEVNRRRFLKLAGTAGITAFPRHKPWFLWVVLLSALFALNCQAMTKGTTSAKLDKEGERFYASHCATCHGPQGDRIPTAPLSSRDFLDTRGDATLLMAISEGKGVMPGFGKERGGPLNDDQVRQVLAFLSVKSGRNSTASLLAGVGKSVYEKNCVRCHGERGDRVPIAPLTAKGFLDNLSDADLVQTVTRGKGVMPPMEAEGRANLSDEDIRAVVAFLRFRVDARVAEAARWGRELYFGQCLGCHGERGDRVSQVELASGKFLQSLGDGRIVTAINQGKGPMPGFGETAGGGFTIDDTAAVLVYVKAWAGLKATAALAPPALAAAQGKELYVSNCASCHGETADRVTGFPLMSAKFLESRTGPVLFQTVSRGNSRGMPAWAQSSGGPLTDTQINSILDYLRSASRGAAPIPGGLAAASAAAGVDPALTARGKDLFLQTCVACHGQTRDKMPTAKLADRAWLQTRGDEALMSSIANGKGAMPGWGKAKGGALSDEDIKSILAYLKSEAAG